MYHSSLHPQQACRCASYIVANGPMCYIVVNGPMCYIVVNGPMCYIVVNGPMCYSVVNRPSANTLGIIIIYIDMH